MKYPVDGMHCPACESLIEKLVPDHLPGVQARADRLTGTLDLGDGELSEAELLPLAQALNQAGYALELPGRSGQKTRLARGWLAFALAAAVLGAFFGLQTLGLDTWFAPDNLDAGAAFVLGLVAGFSSCFALVGGLLLTWTAELSAQRPQLVLPGALVFHLGRLTSFAVLGGILGLAGDILGLMGPVSSWLLLAAALAMVLFGLNLSGLVPGFGPKAKPATAAGRSLGLGSGFLLGAGTFFIPCGFTQSVQFQALASGSFADGALLMLAFALGTLPVLALVSFGLAPALGGAKRRLLLQTSGFLVLGLGLFQLWGALRALGWLRF